MKLTLTRGQIHDARDTLIWIRTGAQMSRLTGGFPIAGAAGHYGYLKWKKRR